ncbi:hypothetical protein PBI_MOZY_93 [Mycobacterium phage Mozy]|uniref:Uncharacterized protein n=1 Tax=Mycobacterium phage Mozy TaxID=2922213 RepID=G1D4K7_9CAUD|nr:hypothetical protein FGG28_gp093 [Mycobacterium phage Mozy]AEK09707.1 hypothetical protein PBI_MOZY_93 [Mycobacterium phage Mozy]
MIYVECHECRMWSQQGCLDCAMDKADAHQRRSGHTDIHIIPDTTPPRPVVDQGWAEWLTKGKP